MKSSLVNPQVLAHIDIGDNTHFLLQVRGKGSGKSFMFVPRDVFITFFCVEITIHPQILAHYSTVKPVLSSHSKRRPKIGFQDRLLLNAGQKYCRMLPLEHSAILSTFIKLPFVFKTSVLSIFEWPLKTGFTVYSFTGKMRLGGGGGGGGVEPCLYLLIYMGLQDFS